MSLLRRVLGDALRRHRVGQERTLREVATTAQVSLGYLSEVERGRKEASSELLGAICAALGVRLADVLREVADDLAVVEPLPTVLPALPVLAVSVGVGTPSGRAEVVRSIDDVAAA